MTEVAEQVPIEPEFVFQLRLQLCWGWEAMGKGLALRIKQRWINFSGSYQGDFNVGDGGKYRIDLKGDSNRITSLI